MSQIKASIFTGSTEVGKLAEEGQIAVPEISDTQILVKNVAVAANPTDWKHIVVGMGGKKGDVIGCDIAGYVEKVGSKVTNFNKGDAVAATLRGNYVANNGGFAEYTAVEQVLTQKIPNIQEKALSVGDYPPSSIDTFEAAASYSLSLATVGLSFSHNFQFKETDSSNADKYVLVWGGATAAGIFAIQVAKSIYGFKVITTASKKHHDFLKSLGADVTFDYKDANVVEQIRDFGKGKIQYAYDTVSSSQTLQQVYDATEGSENVEIDNLLFLSAKNIKTDEKRDVKFHVTLVYLAGGHDHMGIESTPKLQQDFNRLWQDLVPNHLPKFKTPALKVLKPGYSSTNEALDLLRNNKVSGQKVVFRI